MGRLNVHRIVNLLSVVALKTGRTADPFALYALDQLARLPEQCTHELPLGDCLFRVPAMAIVAVFCPDGAPLPSAPPCSRQWPLPCASFDLHRVPRRVRGSHWGAWRKGNGSGRLFLRFIGLLAVLNLTLPPSGLSRVATLPTNA